MFGHAAFAEVPFAAFPEAAAPPSGFQVVWAKNSNQLVWDTDMKKNVASQVIGVQMVSATDGSAFTGSATVVITGDGGTQSASGGTGPTHEGNGYHTYVPTQAETNFDHIGFTFTGSGAVPSTIQVYTDFPQTGDNFTRLGAPAGASISADIATVDTVVDGIQTDLSNGTDGLGAIKADTAAILVGTAEIGTAGAGLTAVPWNSAWDAEVQSECNDALVALHLDHAFAVDYDPASPPGVATALFNELIESDAGVSRFTVNALENGPSGSGASAEAIADAVWDEAQADHVAAGSFGEVATEVASILVDTAEIGAAGAGLTALATQASVDTIDSNVDAVLVDTGTTLPATLSGLNDLSAAQVNAEVVDVLRTDTVAEPTGVPSTTATLADKIGDIHMALVNQVTVTATKKTVHDAGGAAEWEKDLSDDGTTYTETSANAP